MSAEIQGERLHPKFLRPLICFKSNLGKQLLGHDLHVLSGGTLKRIWRSHDIERTLQQWCFLAPKRRKAVIREYLLFEG